MVKRTSKIFLASFLAVLNFGPVLANHQERKVDGLDDKKPPQGRPIDEDKVDENEKVKGFGLPQKQFLEEEEIPATPDALAAISDGTILELGKTNGEADFLGVNGTSGGPVINSKGEVVGIFWGKQRTPRESMVTFTQPGGIYWLEKYGYPRERALFVPLNHVETFIKDLK